MGGSREVGVGAAPKRRWRPAPAEEQENPSSHTRTRSRHTLHHKRSRRRACTARTTGLLRLRPGPDALLDEQHLPIRRQRLELVGNHDLELVAERRAATPCPGRSCRACTSRASRPTSCCDRAPSPATRSARGTDRPARRASARCFLPSLLGAAGGLRRRDALGDLLLVLERRRQDVAVGHQHHQLRLDVDRLAVGLEVDLVARVQLALVEHLELLERLDDRPA